MSSCVPAACEEVPRREDREQAERQQASRRFDGELGRVCHAHVELASRSAARSCIAQPGLPQLTTRAPLSRIASTRLGASCCESSGCVNEYTPAAPQQRPAPASSTVS